MKIAKYYSPELVVSKGKEPNPLLTDPYLDVAAERLVSTNNRGLVALPVQADKGERSRYLACSLLKAARGLGEKDELAEIKDEEIVQFGVLWPAAQERTFPDWKKLVPSWRRGSPGTVTIGLDPALLHAVASAMAAGGVVLTFELGRAADDPGPIVVEPLAGGDELGLLMPMRADDAGATLGPDQVCPVCRRILAAGAHCPTHGDPRAPNNGEVPDEAAVAGEALAAVEKGETVITIRTPSGKEVTATQSQIRAGLDELERRKTAAAPRPPALEWNQGYGCVEADLPDGGSFAVSELGDGRFQLGRRNAGDSKRGTVRLLGTFDTETKAKKRAAELHAEAAADAILENAGAGALVDKQLAGPAAARKKGGRR